MFAQGSGPAVARLFHRWLAAVFLVAWMSLGSQIELLVGSHGLLPLADFLDAARAGGVGLADFPTLLWLAPGDGALLVGTWLGAVLALVWLAGARPRLLAALSTALYLSYAVACRTFCSFQWDNLLLECGLLAALLPTRRPSPTAHLLLRLLLVKLYVESGIAKWQSPGRTPGMSPPPRNSANGCSSPSSPSWPGPGPSSPWWPCLSPPPSASGPRRRRERKWPWNRPRAGTRAHDGIVPMSPNCSRRGIWPSRIRR